MEKEYTWWRLVKSLYTWKHSLNMLWVCAASTVIVFSINWFSVDITYNSTGETVPLIRWVALILYVYTWLWMYFLYNSVKFLFMGCFMCGGVTYFANRGSDKEKREARTSYNEILTWRKDNE